MMNWQFNNNTLVNDIALLRLGQAVRKKANINIVCLPDNGTFASHTELSQSKCFITGWGRSSESESCMISNPHTRNTKTNYVPF